MEVVIALIILVALAVGLAAWPTGRRPPEPAAFEIPSSEQRC